MKKIVKNIFLLLSTVFVVACENGSSASVSNTKPVANAGKYNHVVVDYKVQLDGTSSSDADDDTLAYSWEITAKPDGSEAKLDDAKIDKPSFIADKDGEYEVSLVVHDGKADSTVSSAIIKTMEDVDPNDFIAPTL